VNTSPPLGVYVVWHPRFEPGPVLAQALFRELCADVERTTARNLNVPVRFRTADEGSVPPSIDFGLFQRSAVFVLFDSEMAADAEWRDYIESVASAATSTSVVIPVCFTRTEYLPPTLGSSNGIIVKMTDSEEAWAVLRNRVLHDLCRLLDDDNTKVLVFLSHAKADGREMAMTIKEHLDGHEWLDNFFDEADIPDGSRFADVIVQAAGMAPVLLAIQTDDYSSREWCRLEVLEAKRRDVPVVVLSAMAVREDRAFPYLGNTPVLRWRGAESLVDLVGMLLRQVLRRRYFSARVEHVSQLREEALPEHRFEAPELLTALLGIHLADEPSHAYVYPDPPLGAEELELVRMLDPRHDPVTPTTWLSS